MFQSKVYYWSFWAAMACHMALSLKDVIFINISLRDFGIKVWNLLLSSHIGIPSHSALFR